MGYFLGGIWMIRFIDLRSFYFLLKGWNNLKIVNLISSIFELEK